MEGVEELLCDNPEVCAGRPGEWTPGEDVIFAKKIAKNLEALLTRVRVRVRVS